MERALGGVVEPVHSPIAYAGAAPMQARRLRRCRRLPICAFVTRYEPAFLLFASDAEILALWGLGFLLLAAIAGVMERRRMKRAQIHRVGWVPWMGLFMTFAVVGGGLLSVAVPAVIRG